MLGVKKKTTKVSERIKSKRQLTKRDKNKNKNKVMRKNNFANKGFIIEVQSVNNCNPFNSVNLFNI